MRLSRRELLTTILGAPLATRLATGCEPSEEPVSLGHVEGSFVGPSMELGHRLREAPPSQDELSVKPPRRVPVVIVGGGPAGLSAAWRLKRRGVEDFELLELESACGGTSLDMGTAPWGAHYITTPAPENRDLIALLGELGALAPDARGGRPEPVEELSVREPQERLFYKGFWYAGLYPAVGASAADRDQLARFEARVRALARTTDGSGRKAFTVPAAACSDDAELMALDRITAAEWLRREGFSSGRLRWLLEHGCRDDYGIGLEHTSAWAMLFYHASRLGSGGDAEVITWPEGNGALVRHLSKVAGRERLRPGKLVMDVRPGPSSVVVSCLRADDGHFDRLEAERVILAVPRFVVARLLRGPAAEALPRPSLEYGAWMVANLSLTGRPGSRGVEEAWDNVLYDSPGLGYVSATHQRGRSFGPTTWTYYLPMTDASASAGRKRLLEPSWGDYRDAIHADLSRAHPDLARHLARIDVCRWGHGMVQPRPGVVSSPALKQAAKPIGRLHFAHSDLSGLSLFEEAFHHGVRAADEVADALSEGA